jgi:aspartate aminotransferase-like enzyme
LRRCERRLRPIFGTKGDVLIVGSSGTGGLEAAVASTFGRGARLLAAPVGVFGRRLIAIARAWGCEVEVIETEPGATVDSQEISRRLRADTEQRIDGILLTHNETSTGVQHEMATLAAAIGDHPASVIVDSVSGLGASAFAMDEWGFDVVVSASQKALAAPPGVAMIAVSERGWARIAKNDAPRFYFDLRAAREFASLGQTPWTPPVSTFFALDAALERYERIGAPAIWARHETYARAIRAAARALNLELFSCEGAHSVTVVAVTVPAGVEGGKIVASLREKHGIVISGGQKGLKGKILRIGTMGDLSQNDVIGAIAALETVLPEHGHQCAAGAGVRAAQEIFAGAATTAV